MIMVMIISTQRYSPEDSILRHYIYYAILPTLLLLPSSTRILSFFFFFRFQSIQTSSASHVTSCSFGRINLLATDFFFKF